MSDGPGLLLTAGPPALLLAAGLLPTQWANRHPRAMRLLAGGLTSTVALMSAAAAALGFRETFDAGLTGGPAGFLRVYFDSLSAVMMVLISLVGWIITSYSIRYLEGERTQGRFLRWVLFTLGAVLLLIVSGNLVLFTAAWMLTSLGLHQLLMHYPDRPAAVLAARKKFLISRAGDLMLLASLILTWRTFGSLDFSEIFAATGQMTAESAAAGAIPMICLLYVMGALTKSAQFPLHTWLPDTMETPTPVSALMHAGIINAGGFLIIRLSPLITLSSTALALLAIIGAVTAVYGAVVMLTQTSVKRSLAYSTIAQMGFMMLQCGLGAFSAALLHLVAHSFYKAHAFLSSGSVLDTAAGLRTKARPIPVRQWFGVSAVLAMALAVSISLAVSAAFPQPGGKVAGPAVLGLILGIALTHLLWQAFRTARWSVGIAGIVLATGVCVLYRLAYSGFDALLLESVSHRSIPLSPFGGLLLLLVGTGFVALFLLQALTDSPAVRHRLLESLYVHASSGFYIDVVFQRLVQKIWPCRASTGSAPGFEESV